MRIAIVGTGIAGLTCAHLLGATNEITVFERDRRPGGHANTVRVDLAGESHDVDTGFIVYNERNYPGLVRLLARLGVATKASDMSFSVSDEQSGIEWRGTSLSTVFARRSNALRPRFQRMLADVVRFNRAAQQLLEVPVDPSFSLGTLLEGGRWSEGFIAWYLIPLASAIWSASPHQILEFPAATLARFFDNHGLLRLGDQPRWRTVEGGSTRYVRTILDPIADRLRLGTPVEKITRSEGKVEIVTARHGVEHFDHVVVATHSDEALALLSDPTPTEHEVLGSIAYQDNLAVLHTDARLLPRNRRAWASWNYHGGLSGDRATLTYHLNRLQSISAARELCVTLNRLEAVDPATILATFDYAHPVFNARAVAAQERHHEVSGRDRTWYCGAYWGYGFHEDGLQSALRVCRAFGATL